MAEFNHDLLILGILAVVVVAVFVTIGLAWLLAKAVEIGTKNVTTAQGFYGSLRPAFQRVAQIHSGQILPGPMYEFPRMRFQHQGRPVLVEPHPTGRAGGGLRVSVRIPWPDAGLRMEVYPCDILAELRRLIGMRDLQVGDAAFDRRYSISANHRQKAKELLTPEARELIEQLRGQDRGADVYIRIGGGELVVQRRQVSGDHAELMELVDLSLRLFEAALRQPMAGIEFVDEPLDLEEAPSCQVCGEAVDTPEVMCAVCQTPHHHDCWQYYGGCSTYGCRGQVCEPFTPLRK